MTFDHFHRVGPRLFLDDQADGGLAIEPGHAARLLERVLDVTDVLDPHKIAVLVGHDQLAEAGRVFDAAHGPQHQLPVP